MVKTNDVMKETFSEWMFSHLILLSSGKLSNVSLHHNTPSLSDSHTPLIFTSLLPPASSSLSAGPSFWGETAVVSQWTESNPSNSNGCEIGFGNEVVC